MKIYAVRHAHTTYNRFGILNGNPKINVRLTKKGIAQAEETARKLKDTTFDHIVISEMPRTRQTAEIINQYHHQDMSVQPLFNDIRTGMEGWPFVAWQAFRWMHGNNPTTVWGSGESLSQAAARVNAGIDELLKEDYSAVLVVVHMHTIHRFQERFRGKIEKALNADVHIFDTTSS